VNIIPIISVVFVIAGIRLFKQKVENKVNYFSLLMFASAVYSLGYFLELNCVSLSTLLLVRNFEFLGSVFVPTFGILFIRDLTKIKIIKKSAGILFAISAALWLIFITNPLHHLIYKSIDLRVVGGFSVPFVAREPFFYSLMVYYAFFLIFAGIILLKAYKKSDRRRNKNNFLFLLVSLQIPWLTILFILLRFDTYIDPVPATIIIICVLFGINEIKNDRFEVQINKWISIFANADELAFMVDSAGEIICSNIKADSFFGDTKKSIKNIIKNLNESESYRRPVFFTINKEIKWFNIKKYNFDTQKKLLNYLLIDITESKQAEEAVRENEKRLIAAQQMAHVGNWELNLDTKTVWASDEAFILFGVEYASQYLPLDLVQKNIFPEYRKALDEALIALITKKEKYDEKYKVKNIKTGEERFVHSKAILLVDGDGNAVKVVGTIQDITEYKNRKKKPRDILIID
jgi:PAS domain S-box-containing protein